MFVVDQDLPPPSEDSSIAETPDDPRTRANGGGGNGANGSPARAPSAVDVCCWASELGDPNEPPEREVWLLKDNLTGKPALPIGRTALLAAAGGTGKTTVAVQLAIAVASGLVWLGFKVETPGHVVLACGESDRKLLRRHLYRACNAYSLTREQRTEAMSKILVFPLAGHDVSLLRGNAGSDLERTEFLAGFRARLEQLATEGRFGWSLIVLDPLSRFSGSDTEVQNWAATKFGQTLETLCTLPGAPAVFVCHHSSKLAIRSGANDARGVTALRDAFRSLMVLTRVRAEGLVGAVLRCDKSNEAVEFADRWLVRQDRETLPGGGWLDVGGTLRLASDDEAERFQEANQKTTKGARPAGKAPASAESAREALLARLRKAGGAVQSRRWLVDHTSGFRAQELYSALRELVAADAVTVEERGPNRGTVRLTDPGGES